MTFNSPPPPKEKAHTFSARYLGFLPVAESELVPGQCVKVVHACIKTMAAAHGEQSSVSEKVHVCVCVCVHPLVCRRGQTTTSFQ